MDRWAAVKRLHQAALQREVGQRAVFLDQACGGDEALRLEVESLLTYELTAESFLESPALEVAARSVSQEPFMPLVGRTLGHYRVESLLGAGGMGEVYLARDPRLDRTVALKILPPYLTDDADRLQRFMSEAKAASALNHPNVATIHDIGESDGVRFIVMEYVEGQTLAEQMAGRPLAAAVIVDIALQVADALEAAHAKGITHRDIKPANLMRTPRGQVKVLDFGVAKTASRESPTQTSARVTGSQTAAGVVIGSAPYMSPEQVLGRDVDHRSDLFSLGVTLYELATGRPPFVGATPSETMGRILHTEPQPIAGLNDAIPSELERITIKCLEKDVTRRYQSARDLLGDLRHQQQRDADRARFAQGEPRVHNLPAQLTSFVGRQRELEELRRLLAHNRLLTLTGAGGCGKTRLALQAASELLKQFPDGIWVADLAPLSDPGLIAHTVAAILGVREGPARSIGDALAEHLRPRRLLLVLDNCEHVIGGCAHLVEPLLRAAAHLQVLATSREALGISGETVWRVPSMSAPPTSDGLTRETLLQYEAVRLFSERVAAAEPTFAITENNAATVGEVCRRLDGIPLAIELAASRLRVLSIEQVNERLRDRFRLLTGGSRTAVARQRTLEAAIDWSFELLSDSERTLLCRFSVFPDGWTLEAAEDVCAGDGLDQERVLDLLSHLVDKSLVNVEDDTGGVRRYRCLETIRHYGRERLVRSKDAQRLRDQHLRFFSALVHRAKPQLLARDQVSWMDRLQKEYGNLRSALEWCVEEPGHEEQAVALAGALPWFWLKRGYLDEGRRWLERALSLDGSPSGSARAEALNGLGLLTFFLGDYPSTCSALESSLAVARAAGDLGQTATSLGLQAILAMETGDAHRSTSLAHECCAVARASGEGWRQSPALECLAYQAMDAGDCDRACALTEEALEELRKQGDKWAIAIHLSDLAVFRLRQGHPQQTERLCAEAIRLLSEWGDRLLIAYCLAYLAAARGAASDEVRAATLWGATHGLLDSVASPLQESVKTLIGHGYMEGVRGALGADAFDAAFAKGRSMTLADAVMYTLEGMGSSSERQGH